MSVLVCEGDSITAGTVSYPYPSGLRFHTTWGINNVAVSGSTVQGCIDRAPTSTDPFFASGQQAVIIWAGTNTGGLTAAQTWSKLSDYAAARKVVGWKVIVVTMLSRVAEDTYKNTLNALIRANWLGTFDALFDIAVIPVLGADGAYANTNYFIDGVHPTVSTEQNIVVPFMQSGINAFFSLSAADGPGSGASTVSNIRAEQPTSIIDYQKQKAGVTTVSGVDTAIFTKSVTGGTIGPGEGFVVIAGWHHSTGTTITTYKLSFGGTTISFLAETATPNSNQQACRFVFQNLPGSSSSNELVTMFGNGGKTNLDILPSANTTAIDTTSNQTLSLLANAASNADVITPDFWLVVNTGTGAV